MIVQRLASEFLRRDWSAVALNFALVVLGVVIALQVVSANDRHRQKSHYRSALEALEGDLDDAIARVKAAREIHAADLPIFETALKALSTCETSSEADAAIDAALGKTHSSVELEFATANIDALIADPAFARRTSPIFRKTLIRYRALSRAAFDEIEAQDRALDGGRVVTDLPGIRLRRAPNDYEDDAVLRDYRFGLAENFAVACQDQRLLKGLFFFTASRAAQAREFALILEETDKLKDVVAMERDGGR